LIDGVYRFRVLAVYVGSVCRALIEGLIYGEFNEVALVHRPVCDVRALQGNQTSLYIEEAMAEVYFTCLPLINIVGQLQVSGLVKQLQAGLKFSLNKLLELLLCLRLGLNDAVPTGSSNACSSRPRS
jgi:hypothetical protein